MLDIKTLEQDRGKLTQNYASFCSYGLFDHTLQTSGQFSKCAQTKWSIKPIIVTGAMADFINEGAYAHHVRRMRDIYLKRQQFFFRAG